MTTREKEQQVKRMAVALHRRRDALLAIPGCTGVAIGLKEVGGERTRTLALIVFVAAKRPDVPEAERVPATVEGYPTDVVERPAPRPELIATDPFALHDPVFSGISVTPYEAPPAWGSIGCFIYTTGDPANNVPTGNYLLTCEHVLAMARGGNPRVIQPKCDEMVPPPEYVCANYVQGFLTPTLDCAIASMANGRGFENEVPNYPWYPGRRDIEGVGVAVPGDEVYKYGATSKFTRGTVVYVHYTPPGLTYQDTILIEGDGDDDKVWVARGDSGSVTIRQEDDYAIGLNFAGSPPAEIEPPPHLPALPAYHAGFAYDLRSQMEAFVGPGGWADLA
jgi:hypothetical protein